ncbi:hypothetical protein DERP_002928 [Dermatophagoides pteronyssinus]|uniref:Uncharacterized protein n=1 Tax=Dermatophagoides pteronyssinus TaxID=6956 RepID=A0ABQ8JWL0_DERPT|nr:hypothetical protein DERP_002928 [Dermatophagoides pteronyssinus]
MDCACSIRMKISEFYCILLFHYVYIGILSTLLNEYYNKPTNKQTTFINSRSIIDLKKTFDYYEKKKIQLSSV